MSSSSIVSSFAVLSASAVLLVSSASCGPARGECSPETCNGCCDAEQVCQPGFIAEACGANGGACVACTSPLTCGGGVCVSSSGGGGDAGTDGGMCRIAGASCTAGSECCSASCANGSCAGDTDGGPSCETSGDRQTQVCARWACERADLSEGTWTGNIAACNPGDNPENRMKAVRLVNLYRFLAELPEVTHEATRDQKAQECALILDANDALSHTPPNEWDCYSADGAAAAGKSNIATTPGVQAIDLYMVDPGNDTTLGHRRWVLAPNLGPIGSGSTSDFSCLWVIGGTGSATRDFVTWPPSGPFPLAAFSPSGAFGSSINQTGWSIQSETISLASAFVSVTDVTDGESLPIDLTQLLGGYGSKYAVRFNPKGWAPQAGHSYQVTVTNVAEPFSYQVDVVDCP